MPSPKAVLKSVGPKLVPFFKTVAIYFVLFIPSSNPSWFACLIKILPIISLCVFVLLHGMNLSDEYAYSRRILCGLVFSMIGDAFLIWKQYFVYGMVSFGVAQLLYSSAFGLTPIKPLVGATCFFITSVLYICLNSYLQGVIQVFGPVYACLITVMVWRAVARLQFFEDLWTWTKLCSCVGAVLFCISDTIISINAFAFEIPHSQLLIMVTYYAAQVGIALSVVDSMEGSTHSQKQKTSTEASPTSNPLKLTEEISAQRIPLSQAADKVN